jgi:NADPH:quinone reductase-like Zn-dependent oxidoreductase
VIFFLPSFLNVHPRKEARMRAIVVTQPGGPEVLEVRELPDPSPAADEVLIRVRAFGLNHADTYMRSGVWPFGIPVLGIECAGTVEQDPSGRLAQGATVVALVAAWRACATRSASRCCASSAPIAC